MVVLFVGDEVPSGPFGAKGAGETANVPPAGAIANAVANATGVHLFSLPMKPGPVLAALRGEATPVSSPVAAGVA
jgi:CO/xanthine dehydrogenase Mo-binding subunit